MTSLLVLGVDHHSAPASVRELLAFDGSKLSDGLALLKADFPDREFAILSTCNRVEVYSAGNAPGLAPDALVEFLGKFHRAETTRFATHLIRHNDENTVKHLFRVAASLESLVLGEGQILGQVKEAYQAAVECKAVGPVLHAVFQQALRVGKKVREETGLDQGKLSIASVAVDVAREVFDTFTDKTVLVIGAGKMADLTLRHLSALNPGRIVVTNRSLEKAELAAKRWGGQAIPWDRLNQALIDADVVVSTTAAEEPIVTAEQYARVQRARRNRLALILDIAIPRDFDSKIGDFEQVMLYNVDDLSAMAERNRKNRRKGIDPAIAIIERETSVCLAAIRHQRSAGSIIKQLGDYADNARQRELDKLFSSCPNLSDLDKAAIAHMTHRLQNQWLHHPRSALRSAAEAPSIEGAHPLLNAVRHLFGLGKD